MFFSNFFSSDGISLIIIYIVNMIICISTHCQRRKQTWTKNQKFQFCEILLSNEFKRRRQKSQQKFNKTKLNTCFLKKKSLEIKTIFLKSLRTKIRLLEKLGFLNLSFKNAYRICNVLYLRVCLGEEKERKGKERTISPFHV